MLIRGGEGVEVLEDGGELCSPPSSKDPSPPPATSSVRAGMRMQGEGYGVGVGRTAHHCSYRAREQRPHERIAFPRFLLRPALRRSPAGHGRWGFALWRSARQPQPAALHLTPLPPAL